jgi:hypothetical protein
MRNSHDDWVLAEFVTKMLFFYIRLILHRAGKMSLCAMQYGEKNVDSWGQASDNLNLKAERQARLGCVQAFGAFAYTADKF